MATNPADWAGSPAATPADVASATEPKVEEAKEDVKSKDAPAEADKLLVFNPSYAGTLNSTKHVVTKTQLVEAGVPADEVFTDPKRTEVEFSIENQFSVPVSEFHEAAVKRLTAEPDISVQ